MSLGYHSYVTNFWENYIIHYIALRIKLKFLNVYYTFRNFNCISLRSNTTVTGLKLKKLPLHYNFGPFSFQSNDEMQLFSVEKLHVYNVYLINK